MNGLNQETVQARNRDTVLCLLQQTQISTRSKIAKQIGLKQATIANIIGDLIDIGLVKETGLIPGEKGRRSVGIRLSDEKYRIIGLRLTRKGIAIGVFSLDCKETREQIYDSIENYDPKTVIERACALIEEIIKNAKDEVFLAVGVSVPGPYYSEDGEIALITSFPGWVSINIRDMLQEQISIPVIIEHDANAAILAESFLVERRKKHNTIVYISAGQGIGAGIINGGQIYRGAQGIAGEIGHVCVQMNGLQCECGARGCLQMYASTQVLTENIRKRLNYEKSFDFNDAVHLIQEGNEAAREEFRKCMDYLGVEVINIIYTYNPNLIIFGDEFSKIGTFILDELKARLKTMRVERLLDGLCIELAELGFDSAYVGAAMVATRYVFSHVNELFDSKKGKD